jgi:hypothetical protein
MIDKMDDLDWLDKHWWDIYNGEYVGAICHVLFGLSSKSVCEIIREMRDNISGSLGHGLEEQTNDS